MSHQSSVGKAEPVSPEELRDLIRDAWYKNRPIVPLVGAGFSVDSGMPALRSIVRYIAKIKAYLRYQLFGPVDCQDLYQRVADQFKREPYQYLDVFGWPDRFQLNEDVLNGFRNQGSSVFNSMQAMYGELSPLQLAIINELDELAHSINPVGSTAFDRLRLTEANVGQTIKDAFRNHESLLFELTADWKPLLREVTGFRADLVDALFARLANRRRPNIGHIFLAHLCQLFCIRTIFTFNFDSLIEAGLESEGVKHRVFSMENGSSLPSPTHLDQSLALIKMHGSTHNILVDERVDYKISEEYRKSFRALVGDDPLILLMGVSGGDRRLRDLIGSVLVAQPETSAIWMHRAENIDVPDLSLLGLPDKTGQLVRFPTFDIGHTLRSVFCSITDRFPATKASYSTRIFATHARLSRSQKSINWEIVEKPVTTIEPANEESISEGQLLDTIQRLPLAYTRLWIDLEEHYTLPQVVTEILEQMRRGDTELFPYVPQVNDNNEIQHLVRRVRRGLDRKRYVLIFASLDAFAWQTTTHHGFTTSDGRIAERMKIEQERLYQFLKILLQDHSNDWKNGESIILVHWENNYSRHRLSIEERKKLDQHKKVFNTWLTKLVKDSKPRRLKVKSDNLQSPSSFPCCLNAEGQSLLAFFESNDENQVTKDQAIARALGVAIMACHRRVRSNVGLNTIFQMFIQSQPKPDILRTAFEFSNDGLRTFLGKAYWRDCSDSLEWDTKILAMESGVLFMRPWRDAIYDFNSRFTGSDNLKELKEKCESNAEAQKLQFLSHARASLTQYAFNAALHDLVAKTYYLHLYCPSRDGHAYLEFVYHRISSLRYLKGMQEVVEVARQYKSWTFEQIKSLFASEFWQSAIGRTCGDDWKGLLCFKMLAGSNVSQTDQKNTLPLEQIVFDEISKKILYIQKKGLSGFNGTWEKHERSLRATLPSQQFLQWCNTLLYYDLGLDETFSRVVQVSEKERRNSPCKRAIECVRETAVRLSYRMANFDDHVRNRNTFHASSQTEESEPAKIDGCVKLLWKNFTEKGVLINERGVPDVERVPEFKVLTRDPKKVDECELRKLVIWAEVMILGEWRDQSVADRIVTEHKKQSVSDLINELSEAIDVAYEKATHIFGGQRANRLSNSLDSFILEGSKADGFIPYRSLLLLSRGRLRAMEARIFSGKEMRRKFRDAFRDLAHSRSFVTSENEILLVMSYLHSAETCLQQINSIYFGTGIQPDPIDPQIAIGEIKAKLEGAAGYLERCQQELLSETSYALYWRFFLILQAEIQIENVIAKMFDIVIQKRLGDRLRSIGQLVDRSRKCLRSIRSCLDLTTEKDKRIRDHIQTLWLNMRAATILSVVIEFVRTNKVDLFSERVNRLRSFWLFLNKSEAIQVNGDSLFSPELAMKFFKCAESCLLLTTQRRQSLSEIRNSIFLDLIESTNMVSIS